MRKEDVNLDKGFSRKNYFGVVIFTLVMWLWSPIMLRAETIRCQSKATVNSCFGEELEKSHKGADTDSQGEAPIYSAIDGTVSCAGFEEGYGNLIQVSSDNDIVIYYGNCSSIEVKLMDVVHKGDLIGRVLSAGNSTGPHLHFEVRIDGVAVNPTKYIE